MEIRIAREQDRELWNGFIESAGCGSFYHLFEWKSVMERSFGHKTFYLMAMQGMELQGILPLILVKGIFFGPMVVSMPFLNYGGLCAVDEEVEKALLEEAIKITTENSAKYLELRSIKENSLGLRVRTHKVSMTIPLDPNPDKIWKAFSTKLRTNIRRSAKNDLRIRVGGAENLDDFYNIFIQNMRDLGTPVYKKEFFENILAEFGEQIRIFVLAHKEKAIATAFNGLFKHTVEGMWASSLREFEKLLPNYLLYWEMIKYFCENGFKYFHLGRSSKDSGSLEFKRKWSAVPQQLYWYYYLNGRQDLPQLNPENPKFNFAIRSWQRLPVWVTKLIGPRIAKGIP